MAYITVNQVFSDQGKSREEAQLQLDINAKFWEGQRYIDNWIAIYCSQVSTEQIFLFNQVSFLFCQVWTDNGICLLDSLPFQVSTESLFVKWLHVFMCGGCLHSCLMNYFHSCVYQLKSVNCQLCEYELNYANLTCFVSFVNWIVPTELKCQLNKCIYYIHAYFKSHTNYLNILCIFSCMQ